MKEKGLDKISHNLEFVQVITEIKKLENINYVEKLDLGLLEVKKSNNLELGKGTQVVKSKLEKLRIILDTELKKNPNFIKDLEEFDFDEIEKYKDKTYFFYLLKEVTKRKRGYEIFYYIGDLKNKSNLSNYQILELFKIAGRTREGAQELKNNIGKIKKELDLSSIQIFELLSYSANSNYGYSVSEYINGQEGNANYIIDKFIALINNNNSFLRDLGDGNRYLLYKWFNENIYLGKDYSDLSKHFGDSLIYQEFIEYFLINRSTIISSSINRVYHYLEDSTLNEKEVKKGINSTFENLSIEELISSLGNHSVNYSGTFKLILKEIDRRLDGQEIFIFIDKNNTLNNKTKDFLKGQIIVGLSARAEISRLDILLKRDKSYKIIKDIIGYRNSEIFNRQTYIGLIIGLTNILKINNNFAANVYEDYFIEPFKNKKFKKALEISLYLEGKKLTLDGLKKLNKTEENEDLKEVKEAFLLPLNDIFSRKNKDIVLIYGGNTKGGGIENYNTDINTYKSYGYKETITKKGFITLEKEGVRVIFIDYDKNNSLEDIFSNSIEKIIKDNNIDPIMLVYRGHNYYTSEMIKKTKGLSEKATIVDGGCRNVSLLLSYKEDGINNPVIAYTSEGRGSSTLHFVSSYITNFLRKELLYRNRDITWKELSEEILKRGSYEKEFMKFPGDLVDIITEIES